MAKRLLSQPSAFGETSERVVLEAQDAVMASEKVCIVCSLFMQRKDIFYSVYLFDLNKPNPIGIPTLDPVLQLESTRYPIFMAFALCGSILYMFGGRHMNPDLRKGKKKNELIVWESTVFGYDFSRGEPLGELPDMKAEKVEPSAVVVDGKVCVFPRTLYHFFDDYIERPSFELFDPTQNSWLELPEPMAYPTYSPKISVDSYCVEGSRLFISISNRKQILCLDTSRPTGWTSFSSESFPFEGGSLLVDGVCFSPYCAYLFSPAKFDCPFPLYFLKLELQPPGHDFVYMYGVGHTKVLFNGGASIARVGERILCTVKVGHYHECSDPYIHVEIFKFCSSSREMSKSCVLDFSFINTINNEFPLQLPHEYSDLLEFDLLKSFKCLLGGIPCKVVNMEACFPM